MPEKKRGRKPPSPYVKKRVQELSDEHGWNADEVSNLIAEHANPPEPPKSKKVKK